MDSYNIYEDKHIGALIDASPLGIIVLDAKGYVTKWNPAAEQIFGWKEEEILGKINPVLPEGRDEEYDEIRARLLSGGSIKGRELIRRRKDNSLINVRTHTSLIKDSKGIVLGVIGMYEDITEEKKIKEKLIWNELLLRQMNESTNMGFYVVDNRSDKVLFANLRFKELWNLNTLPSPEKNTSHSEITELCSAGVKDKNKFREIFLSLRDFRNISTFEDEIELANGKTISFYTTRLQDEKNNYIGRFYLFEDITERKIYETLQKSETEYTKAIEQSPEAIMLVSSKGSIHYINNRMYEFLKIKKNEILKKDITALFDTEIKKHLGELSIGKTLIASSKIKIAGNDEFYELHLKLYSPGRAQLIIKEQSVRDESNRLHSSFTESQCKFIFASETMKRINFEISRLAMLDFDVLLEGETGAGKDMVAAQIYLRSSRNKHPFVPVSIGSLSDNLIESELFGHEKGAYSGADKLIVGKFESANHGVLYIPEISSLPESIQLKLLYFMQYKTISRVGQDARKGEIKLDVRLIMATNENLAELVEKGKIRKDFYYRITGTKITIPPLRERKEDIAPLANYFLEQYSKNFEGKKFIFSPEVIAAFESYPWNGNVRELANCIKNVLSFTGEPLIKLEQFEHLLDLNSTGCENGNKNTGKDIVDYENAEYEFKREYFMKILKQTNNKISEAAKLAGMTPQGLRKILNKLNLRP